MDEGVPGISVKGAVPPQATCSGFRRTAGCFCFGTATLARDEYDEVPEVASPCTVGCLLDADAGAMTVFVDGEPLAEQCKYRFPTDGREWAPTVGLYYAGNAVFSIPV